MLGMDARVGCSVVAAGLLVGSSAMAQWPAMLSKAPADAQIIVAVDSMSEVNEHWKSFIDAIGLGGMPVGQPSDMFVDAGFNMESIDLDGSFGIVVLKDRWENDEPPMVALIPVSDFDGFVASMGGSADGDLFVGAIEGESIYAKNLDGHAVLSPSRDLVANYTTGEDVQDHFEQRLGTLGEEVVQASDIIIMVDPAGLDQVILPAMRQQMTEMGAMAAGMGGANPADIEEMQAAAETFVTEMINQTDGLIFGVSMNGDGLAFHKSVQWKKDGSIAGFFTGDGDSIELLEHFPNKPYIFAFAADLDAADLMGLGDYLKTKMREINPDLAEKPDTATTQLYRQAEGAAGVLYPSPAGIMGGLFNQMVLLYAGDNDELREIMKQSITEMNGQEIEGASYTTSYESEVEEVAGTTVDKYQVRMRFPPEMMQAQQAVSMMFGPAGMRGYVAEFDGGVIQTLAMNKVLLGSMLEEAGGLSDGLAENDMIESVNSLLPEEAIMRFYLGAEGIMSMAGPMLAMAIPGANMDAFTGTPPIAGAVESENGALHAVMVIPAPLIKTAVEFGMQAQMAADPDAGGADTDEPLF
ncbi:MAG: hypothetical protein ACF8PN_09065 [Phycisphaerales bacterium]